VAAVAPYTGLMLGAKMEIPAERYYSVTVLINIASASILCFAAVCAASAQSPAAEPKFEVASVRLTTTLGQAIADRSPGATVTYSGARHSKAISVFRVANCLTPFF
jgi:hypothetical protein